MFRNSLFGVALCLSAAATARASFYTIAGETYTETGPTEDLTATFSAATGATTANTYQGLVELTVSGSGQARGTQLNDAFYVYTDSSDNPITPIPGVSNFYQVTVDDAPLGDNDTAWDAKYFTVYDINAGTAVGSRPYVPAYRSNHVYSFIIDTSISPIGLTFPSKLDFGVSDGPPGGFSDNAGGYGIQVTQLAQVPEPGTLSLMAVGAAGLLRRRRR
jgi:hypothetical protein